MTTLSKKEYLDKAGRGLQPGFGPTTDFADPQIGRTVQHPDGIPAQSEGLPGQVFTVDQLPHPDVALAYGLPPVVVPEHLITDDENHPQGPTAEDRINASHREELGDPVLTLTGDTVEGGHEAALAALEAATTVAVKDEDDDAETRAAAKESAAAEKKARKEQAEAEKAAAAQQ